MTDLKNWNENPHAAQFKPYETLLRDFGEINGYTEITFISNIPTKGSAAIAKVHAIGTRNHYLRLKFGDTKALQLELNSLELARKHFDFRESSLKRADNNQGFCIPIEEMEEGDFVNYYQAATDLVALAKSLNNLFSKKIKLFDNSHNVLSETGPRHIVENIFQMYAIDEQSLLPNLKAIDREASAQALFHWWNQQKNASKRNSYIKVNHNNLKVENISFKDGSLELLDFGNTDYGHFLSDFAQLECSIQLDLLPRDANWNTADYAQLTSLLNAGFSDPQPEASMPTKPGVLKALHTIHSIRKIARTFAVDHLNISQEHFEFNYQVARLAHHLYFASTPIRGEEDFLKQHRIKQLAFDNAQLIRECITELIYDSILWKVAFAFLRLEQLPVGGWARSLPGWLRAIDLKKDKVPHPGAYQELREKGGLAITGEAFLQYSKFIGSSLGFQFSSVEKGMTATQLLRDLANLESANKIGFNTAKFLKKRIGIGGGVDVIGQGDLDSLRNQIHHTLLATVTLFYFEFVSGKRSRAVLELGETLDFLFKNLHRYRKQNTDRYFGTYATAVLLRHILDLGFFTRPDNFANLDNFFQKLDETIDNLAKDIDIDNDVKDIDAKDILLHPDPVFRRSDFLMQLAFLLFEDNNLLLTKDTRICSRLQYFLERLVNEIGELDPEYGLIKFIEGDSIGDFGCSAKLAAYLRAKPIQELLKPLYTKDELLKNSKILKRNLQKCLLNFNKKFENFYFTHGVSFSYYLNLIQYKPHISEIKQLDEAINTLLKNRITERGIVNLLKFIFSKEYDLPEEIEDLTKELNIDENDKDIYRLLVSVKNLFLSKLESGAYVHSNNWEKIRDEALFSTANFFESPLGIQNAEANSRYSKFRPRLYELLTSYVTKLPKESPILDIGCGKGDFDVFFLRHGMQVDIIDNSSKMLALADETIKKQITAAKKPLAYKTEYIDLTDFSDDLRFRQVRNKLGINKNHYQMIFADGVMFHVPNTSIGPIFKNFYKLLQNDGILFVNFKINDHTLISFDGRFFEYYPDYSIPLHWLNMAGFELKEIIITEKSTTMYGKPLFTQWAHYFCVKKSPPA